MSGGSGSPRASLDDFSFGSDLDIHPFDAPLVINTQARAAADDYPAPASSTPTLRPAELDTDVSWTSDASSPRTAGASTANGRERRHDTSSARREEHDPAAIAERDEDSGAQLKRSGSANMRQRFALPLKIGQYIEITEKPSRSGEPPKVVWEINNLPLLDSCNQMSWVMMFRRRRTVWFDFQSSQVYLRPYSLNEVATLRGKVPDEVLTDYIEYMDAMHFLVEVEQKTVQVKAMEDCIMPRWRRVPLSERLQLTLTVRPMRLRNNHGRVVVGSLVSVSEQLTGSELRKLCMNKTNRFIRFLFTSAGTLVCHSANTIKRKMTFKDLFLAGNYSKTEDMKHSYRQAWHAVFVRKEDCYCLPPLRNCRKESGGKRWVLFEMSPTEDPVTKAPMAMVSIYNVSWLKEQLDKMRAHSKLIGEIAQREKVQRTELEHACDQLDKHNQKLEQENSELKHVAEAAEAQLEQVLKGILSMRSVNIDTETPAEKTLALLAELMAGDVPSLDRVVQLHDAINRGADLRQPMNLGRQLLEADIFEKDVSFAMLALLGSQKDKEEEEEAMRAAPSRQGEVDITTKKMMLCDLDEDDLVPKASGLADAGSLSATSGSGDTIRLLMRGAGNHVPKGLMEELDVVLSQVNEWQFDAFRLAEVSKGFPLATLGTYLIIRSGIADSLGLDKDKLVRFLLRIEFGYPDNPYHNRVHAADVLQSVHVIMLKGGLWGRLDTNMVLDAYLAAIIHDFEHCGVSNEFLIRSRNPLAIRYNDDAPQENHHLAASFELLYQEEYNFMSNLCRKEQDRSRINVVEMVMSTDMKQHFNILSQLQSKMNSTDKTEAAYSQLLDENLRLVLQVGLKCADVGHLKSKLEVHKKWVARLEEEFFLQGDREKKNNMPVSPLMDRNTGGVTKSQVGFFAIVAIPLFKTFTDLLPESVHNLQAVMANYEYWQEVEAAAKVKAAEAKAASDAKMDAECSAAAAAAEAAEAAREPGT